MRTVFYKLYHLNKSPTSTRAEDKQKAELRNFICRALGRFSCTVEQYRTAALCVGTTVLGPGTNLS